MFRHELARLSVVEEVPQLRRIALHRKILEALDADTAADPARRAHHAEAAGLGDEAARHALVAAGRAASLGAHKEAVQQYERVLRHSDGAPAEHVAQVPHEMCHGTTTSSPATSPETSSPTSTTSATHSCPSCNGAGNGVRPAITARSRSHVVAATGRTTASPGSTTRASGTSRQRSSRVPMYSKTLISHSLR